MTLKDFKAEVDHLQQDKPWIPREIFVVVDGKKYDIVKVHSLLDKCFIIETKPNHQDAEEKEK